MTAEQRREAPCTLVIWGANFTASLRLPSLSVQQGEIGSSQRDRALKRPVPDATDTTVPEAAVEATAPIADSIGLKALKISRKYDSLLSVGYAKYGELVVVERPMIDLLPSLPPAFYSRQYGQA